MRNVLLSSLLLFLSLAFPSDEKELCPIENCLTPEKCEEPVKNVNVECTEKRTSCCSIVKEEFRTKCRHHGGACMKSCSDALYRLSTDCSDGEICCVLV